MVRYLEPNEYEWPEEYTRQQATGIIDSSSAMLWARRDLREILDALNPMALCGVVEDLLVRQKEKYKAHFETLPRAFEDTLMFVKSRRNPPLIAGVGSEAMPTVLQYLASRDTEPQHSYPLYCLCIESLKLCYPGLREKHQQTQSVYYFEGAIECASLLAQHIPQDTMTERRFLLERLRYWVKRCP